MVGRGGGDGGGGAILGEGMRGKLSETLCTLCQSVVPLHHFVWGCGDTPPFCVRPLGHSAILGKGIGSLRYFLAAHGVTLPFYVRLWDDCHLVIWSQPMDHSTILCQAMGSLHHFVSDTKFLAV